MLFALVILLMMSALVSGSEAAYFSLTPSTLEKINDGEKSSDRKIKKLLDNPEKLLATILIANNFVNVAIVMLSAFVSSALLDFGDATTLKFVFETIIITLLILFFGEVMPKIYSTQHSYGFASFMAMPISFMSVVFTPFSNILMKSTSLVNDRLSRHQHNMSIDELSQAVELTRESLNEEKDILDGIVKFTNLSAADVMTPRMDVVSLDASDKFDEVLKIVLDSGYSRIPVHDEREDDIVGILFVKDLLPHLGTKDFDWKTLLRKPFYVPEAKMINDLLQEFQTSKTHLAVVVDEYGGMSGVVTLEDVIEEIVGDINDELDEEEKMWQRQPDGSIIFESKISLNDFFKVIDSDGDEFEKARGEAETLAGFLLEINGLIPKKGAVIKYQKYKFTILAADVRKIEKVRLVIGEK
ncbi:MAG: gliding motility-associated protein GldE [Bacteroidales bacterium]|nr:gliding motility-associated protein GldE [Bacteroidales bacterium]